MSLAFTSTGAVEQAAKDGSRPARALDWFFLSTALVIGGCGILTVSGLSVTHSLMACGVVGLQATLGGLIVQAFFRRSLTMLEFLGLGLAFGSALVVAVGIIASPLGLWARLWAWCALLVFLVGWRLTGARIGLAGRTHSMVRDRRSSWVAALAGLAIGTVGVALNVVRYPFGGPWERYHPDIPFFEAVGFAAARFQPGHNMFMAGDGIRYHWFAYFWQGQLTEGLALPAFAAQTRVVPLALVIGLCALLAGAVGRMTKSWWAPALAVAVVVTGGFVGAGYGVVLNADNLSTAITCLWLLAFFLASFTFGRGRGASAVLSFAAGFILAGAKVSAMVVAVLTWAVIVGCGVLWKARWVRTSVVQLIALVLGSALSMLMFVLGSTSPQLTLFTWDFRASSVQGLDLGPAWWGVALGTLLLCLATLPRSAGLIGLAWKSPELAAGAGLLAASVIPIWIISHGVNELWFAVAAATPLAVLSVLGLERLWSRVENGSISRTWGFASVVAGVLAAVFVSLLWPFGASDVLSVRSLGPLVPWLVGGTVAVMAGWLRGRALALAALVTTVMVAGALGRGITVFGDVGLESTTGRNLVALGAADSAQNQVESQGASAESTDPLSTSGTTDIDAILWSVDLEEAALWVRSNVGESEVLATNWTDSAMFPAVAQRDTYLSAVPTQQLHGTLELSPQLPQREAVSKSLGAGLSPEARTELCAAQVGLLWIVNPSPGWDMSPIFSNDQVSIFELTPELCGPRADST